MMSLAVRTLLITLGLVTAALFFADEFAVSMLILGTLTLTIVSLLSDVIGSGRSAWAERPGSGHRRYPPAARLDCPLPPRLYCDMWSTPRTATTRRRAVPRIDVPEGQ